MSHSEKKTSWLHDFTGGALGSEYVQHFDDNGNKSGYSKEEPSLLHDLTGGAMGSERTQHYKQDGTPDGYSTTLRESAQKAFNFIVSSQHPDRGSWRYSPHVGSDISVTEAHRCDNP